MVGTVILVEDAAEGDRHSHPRLSACNRYVAGPWNPRGILPTGCNPDG